jgi:hypothetical protein
MKLIGQRALRFFFPPGDLVANLVGRTEGNAVIVFGAVAMFQ